MKNRKEWWKSRLVWALSLSCLLHLAFLVSQFPSFHSEAKKERKLMTVALDNIDVSKLKEQILMREMEKGQVVNTEQNGKKERPQESRFLGKSDQSFDRQSVAAKVASFKEAGKGKKTAQGTESRAPDASAQKPSPHFGKVSLSDLAMAKNDFKEVAPKKKAPAPSALGLEAGKEGTTGLAQSSDYVEDVALGDMSQLNTQEFKYFGFYDRIRQKLEQFWGFSIQEKAQRIYKSGRRIASDGDNITSLRVTLDDRGNIVSVEIKSTSGIREFDDAAIESFNKAGPFPNPPRGMLKNGLAVVEWGFVVKS